MFRTVAFIGAAIGVIGISAAQADPVRLPATDFSSQQKKKGGPPQSASGGQQRGAAVNRSVSVNRNTTVNRNININRNINVNRNPNVNRPVTVQGGSKLQKNIGQVGSGQLQKVGGPGLGGGAVKFGHGPGKVVPYQKANFAVVKVGNKFVPYANQKKYFYKNKWVTFVPLAALGAVAIGGAYYYADSYLTLARPYCSGVTADGCRLNWQRVDFVEGDSEWQCVQYCRHPGAPPPARTVALVAPPPIPTGTCEVSIFSEPGFRGTNATSADEQPYLSELGWRDQVASIKVVSGTWDFFTGEDFTGEVARFPPGEYPELAPEWSRKAGSFMCVQP
jgi:beta/gamma crystallin